MANFDKYVNFTGREGFTSVVFGADAPVLEVELNEMQEIANNKLQGIAYLMSGYSDEFSPGKAICNNHPDFGLSKLSSTGGSKPTDSLLFYLPGRSVIIWKKYILYFPSDFRFTLELNEDCAKKVPIRVYCTVEETTLTHAEDITNYNADFNGHPTYTIANKIKDDRSEQETSRRKAIKLHFHIFTGFIESDEETPIKNTGFLVSTYNSGAMGFEFEPRIKKVSIPEMLEQLNTNTSSINKINKDIFNLTKEENLTLTVSNNSYVQTSLRDASPSIDGPFIDIQFAWISQTKASNKAIIMLELKEEIQLSGKDVYLDLTLPELGLGKANNPLGDSMYFISSVIAHGIYKPGSTTDKTKWHHLFCTGQVRDTNNVNRKNKVTICSEGFKIQLGQYIFENLLNTKVMFIEVEKIPFDGIINTLNSCY